MSRASWSIGDNQLLLFHTVRGERVAESSQRLGFEMLAATNSNSIFDAAGVADSASVVGGVHHR